MHNRIYMLFPSSGDDPMNYEVMKLSKVTKEGLVASLRPLGILGLIPMDHAYGKPDDKSEDDVVETPLLDQVELHDGGEYFAIFGQTSQVSVVRKHLRLARHGKRHILRCMAVRAAPC